MARWTLPGTFAAVVLLLGLAPAALSAEPVPAPPTLVGTVIEVTAPSGVTIGDSVDVLARLTTSSGAPLAGRRLILGVNGVESRVTRTGANGSADIAVSSSELQTAGTLAISVTFDGDSSYRGSNAAATIVIRPASIVVVTVPVVSGLHLTLGETEATTDDKGTATFLANTIGRQQLAPDLELPVDGGLQVSFVRWQDNVFDAARTINITGDDRFVLGLRTAVQTSFRFVDPDGHPVDPSIIESVKLVTASGQDRILTTYRDVWLEAGLPATRVAGLIAVTNIHRISEVMIAGTNVVNRGQQVFEPQSGDVITIELLLYGLEVTAEDALLRWPVSSEVRLEFPDGSVRTGRTDSDGRIAFDDLPRGDYTIRLKTSGIVPPNPIALSRPQQVTIRVISTLDLSIFGAAMLLAVIGLVLLGRRHQVRSAGQRAIGLAGIAADQAAVAANRSDRTAQALLDRMANSVGARLSFRTPKPPVGRPDIDTLRALATKLAKRPWAGLPKRPSASLGIRPRAGLPKGSPASLGIRPWAGLPKRPKRPSLGLDRLSWPDLTRLTEAQRMRLLVVGAAVVGIGMFAAVVAALGQSNSTLDVSPSPSASIAAATSSPHPTPGPSTSAARLRPVIEVNAYLAEDRAALEKALAGSPPGTGRLVELLSQTALHARLATETLDRVGEVGANQPVIESLASRYAEISKQTAAALDVLVSNAAAYEANARKIADLLAEIEPLTSELHVLIEQLSGGPPATGSQPTSSGAAATPSPAAS